LAPRCETLNPTDLMHKPQIALSLKTCFGLCSELYTFTINKYFIQSSSLFICTYYILLLLYWHLVNKLCYFIYLVLYPLRLVRNKKLCIKYTLRIFVLNYNCIVQHWSYITVVTFGSCRVELVFFLNPSPLEFMPLLLTTAKDSYYRICWLKVHSIHSRYYCNCNEHACILLYLLLCWRTRANLSRAPPTIVVAQLSPAEWLHFVV